MSHLDPSVWLDLRPRHRRRLPVALGWSLGLFLLCVAAFTGLVVARVRFADSGFADVLTVVAGTAGIASLGALVVAVMVVAWIPRFLAPQGLGVDDSGIEVMCAAKWWFSERLIRLPWAQVHAVGPGVGRRQGRHGWVVLHLNAVTANPKLPHWALVSHAGSEPPRGEPRSAMPRLYLQLHEDDEVELRRRIRAVRPRILSSTTTPPEPDPQSLAPAAARPREDWLSLRLGRVVRWGVWAVVCLVVPLVMLGGWLAANGLAEVPSDPVALMLLVVGAGGLAAVVGLAPRYWADQGINVNDRGFALVRRGLWWGRGSSAFVPWEQVLEINAVRVPDHAFEAKEPTGVEVLLDRVEDDLPLPTWTKLVRAGTAKRGGIAAVPRLFIDVADPDLTRRAVDLLRRHHPAPVAEGRPAPGRARRTAEPAPAAAAAPVPASDRAATTPAAAATEVRRWIPMRRHVFAYVLCQALSAGFAGAMGMLLVAEPPDGMWIAAVPTAAAGLVALWLAAIAPRLLVRQGIAVDATGIDLTQAGALWFRERGVHIPWTHIAELRQARVPRPSNLAGGDLPVGRSLDLVLREPLPRGTPPTWTRLRPSGDADGHAVLRIHVEQTDALRRAITAFHPELPG